MEGDRETPMCKGYGDDVKVPFQFKEIDPFDPEIQKELKRQERELAIFQE